MLKDRDYYMFFKSSTFVLMLSAFLLAGTSSCIFHYKKQIKEKTVKRIINTEKAPKAIGPYSQAIEVNGFLFISGQIPIHPATGEIVEGGIMEQTRQVLENIKAILDEAGYTFEDVVKSTCFLSDISDFKGMNEVYEQYYSAHKPTRSTIAVKGLPKGALVEIETIASR